MIINRGDWNQYFIELISGGRQDEVPFIDDYTWVSDVDIRECPQGQMPQYRADILDWLENLDRYVTIVGGVVKFQSADDAALFKLTWGGECQK